MAHFAKLGIENIVETVEVVSNDIALTEQAGIDFLNNLYHTDDVWIQTSYNGNIRKNYAGILNETTCIWEAPITYPNDGNNYIWNESTLTWDIEGV